MLKRDSFPGRTFYQSSGRANWPVFLPLLALALIVAALLAFGMFQLFRFGQYYIFILPAIAAAIAAGMVHLAVNKGHCRNVPLAIASGVCAGLVLYLGFYYIGMIAQFGPGIAARPDLLPAYIRARMETDVVHDANLPESEKERSSSASPTMNWIHFTGELGIVLGLCVLFGFQRSRRPYCENCRQWLAREVTQFEPGRTPQLVDAFRTGNARSLAALAAEPVFATVPNLSLAAELCPATKNGTSRDCPVYVSLKDVTKASGSSSLDPLDSAMGKMILRSLQLNANEMAALGSRFKVFETLAGRAAVAAMKPEAPSADAARAAEPAADIRAVEPDYAGKVLTKKVATMAMLLSLGGVLLFVVTLVVLVCGLILALTEVSPLKQAAGYGLTGIGAIGFAVVGFMVLRNPTGFGNSYVRKRAIAEFSRRPKCLVDPLDPEAVFVEIVPKLNWGRPMLDNASDVGFLTVNEARKEILFEGDKQRFRLTPETITYCAVEAFIEGQHTAAAHRVYYLVLRAKHPTEFWEAPLRPRGASSLFGGGKRKKAMQQLFEKIQALRGVSALNPIAALNMFR